MTDTGLDIFKGLVHRKMKFLSLRTTVVTWTISTMSLLSYWALKGAMKVLRMCCSEISWILYKIL